MSAATSHEARTIEPQGPKSLVHMTEERRADIEARLAAHDGAMEELRRDLDRAQENFRGAQRRLAEVSRENVELKRLRAILATEDPETAQAASVAMAARATLDRDRAVNSARVSELNLQQLRSAFSEMRDTLESALQKLDAPNCGECSGTGRFGAEEECDACGGLGLDWEAAS